MKSRCFLVAFSLICLFPVHAAADGCNNVEPQMAWRRCMSKEVDKLATAINRKAFDICNARARAGGSEGPAAIDEGLICRLQTLSQILGSMH